MKTYKELQELAKELQEKKQSERQKDIIKQVNELEIMIAEDLFGRKKAIDWWGPLYKETIDQLLNSGFTVEYRNASNGGAFYYIYKSDNPVFLDKWQEDTDRIAMKYMTNNKKTFWQKLFS